MDRKWFSDPQETIEAAQALHQPKPLAFDPAAVYETPGGQYVIGYLNARLWSMNFVREAASRIEEMTGNRMVAYCEPLLGMWREIE